jgi:SAM-dependent methyltransferase
MMRMARVGLAQSNFDELILMKTMTGAGFRTRMKRSVKPLLVAMVTRLPDGVQRVLFVPRVRRVVKRVPVLKMVYTGCYRTHPIDRLLGTDTGGIIAARTGDEPDDTSENLPYMGSQPSIVRLALKQLPDVHGYTFVDIGCGKGRPMIVATELPFDAVLGYDLNGSLVSVANENAAIVARRFPERTPMRAFKADALELELPRGGLVVFLYNPFGAALVGKLQRNLETRLAAGEIEHLFVIYYNPVCAEVFDASPALVRCFARSIAYAPDELGYGAEDHLDVVIWQSARRRD